jgi:hypothetical protein
MYEYFPQKCMSRYSQKQELSLDEAMIPRLGRLKFMTYNPEKRKK